MPDNQELPPGAASVPASKSSKKFKIIMISLALLLLIGGGGVGTWWFLNKDGDFSISNLFGGSKEPEPAVVESTGKNDAPRSTASITAQGVTQLVSLPTLTVNLADPQSSRYLRVGIDVEVSTPEAATSIKNQNTRIRDSIIILLSSKTYAELASADGKLQLKNEIASRINQILGIPRVVQIYFTEFVVQ